MISVVTPTHGRVEMVARLLASLRVAADAFAREGGEAELIVVDSSSEEEHERIAALACEHAATLLRGANDVRAKRNLGVERARGDVVLFVDSDCVADPRLLVEHAAAHRIARAPDGRPVGGALGLVALTGRRTPAFRAAEEAGFCDGFAFAERYPQADWGPCANISYTRDVLRAVGGFRADWPGRLGGDDVELGLRVNATGRAIVCRPEAVVGHDRATWARWPPVAERAWRWGRMDVHVRAAAGPERRRPAGAGPEIVLAGGLLLALQRRRPADAALALVAAVLLEGPPRVPLVPTLGGAGLRLAFAAGALAEAVRQARPGLVFEGLHPTDRGQAARRARGRTATTLGALAALALRPARRRARG